MSKLVIVESPAKTHTIGSYLGSEYKVVSSKGHIRDLATSGKYGLGVDVDNNFEPNYIEISGKKRDINALKKDVKESEFVYLATDPDREGEAISWHLYDELGIKDSNYERVVFNEITAPAVKEAFNHTRKIDMHLVKSQETRRILDRIIGFRLSKLMQSKTGGKSAGRVQSVALKLVVDREREIESFIPEEYWDVTSHFKDTYFHNPNNNNYKHKLTSNAGSADCELQLPNTSGLIVTKTSLTAAVGGLNVPVFVAASGEVTACSTISVEHGGTGTNSLSAYSLLYGNGTNAVG